MRFPRHHGNGKPKSGEATMFETIDDDIERTEGGRAPISAHLVRFAIILVFLLLFLAALYFAIE
jgi:hypothetical protein